MSGFVYFIGPHPRLRCVKIGHTNGSIRKRLGGIQTTAPWPLHVYAYLRGGRALEAVLHETFAPLHMHGEWFKWDHKLAGFTSDLEAFMHDGRAPTVREVYRVFHRRIACQSSIDPTEGEEWRVSADPQPLQRYWRAG